MCRERTERREIYESERIYREIKERERERERERGEREIQYRKNDR